MAHSPEEATAAVTFVGMVLDDLLKNVMESEDLASAQEIAKQAQGL